MRQLTGAQILGDRSWCPSGELGASGVTLLEVYSSR